MEGPNYTRTGRARAFAWNLPTPSNSLEGLAQYSSPEPSESLASSAKAYSQCDFKVLRGEDLHHHVIEIHEKPLDGKEGNGRYRCRCGNSSFAARMLDYLCHLQQCKPLKWHLDSFLCYCGEDHNDKSDHLVHIKQCWIGKRADGHPPQG